MVRPPVDDGDWRFRRAVTRVEATVDRIVADHATAYVGRPVQRRTVLPPRPLPGITWSIDHELVVEFVHRIGAPDQVLVHDVAVLRELKRRLRSRHLEVRYAETTWHEASRTPQPLRRPPSE